MKALTIRECAYRALAHHYRGTDLLAAILKQAFDGDEQIDWDSELLCFATEEMKALYDAIAPDIIASCGEEDGGAVFTSEITLKGED